MKRNTVILAVLSLLIAALAVVPAFAATTDEENPEPKFTDGRINNSDAAPYAVYGDGESLEVWAPIESFSDEDGNVTWHSEIVLTVTAEQIAAVPAEPVENTLIAATDDMGIALYRLTTGEYQLNAWTDKGEMYVLRFPELYADAGYESEFVKY